MVGKMLNAHRPDVLTLFLGDAVVDARPTSHLFTGLLVRPSLNGLACNGRRRPCMMCQVTKRHCSAPGWNLNEGSSGIKPSE